MWIPTAHQKSPLSCMLTQWKINITSCFVLVYLGKFTGQAVRCPSAILRMHQEVTRHRWDRQDPYLIVIKGCISCDHNAFLNSCFRDSTFHSLEITKKKKEEEKEKTIIRADKQRITAKPDFQLLTILRSESGSGCFFVLCFSVPQRPTVKVTVSMHILYLKAVLKIPRFWWD